MYNPIDQDTKLQPKIFKQMDMASTVGPMGSPLSLHHLILYLKNSVTPLVWAWPSLRAHFYLKKLDAFTDKTELLLCHLWCMLLCKPLVWGGGGVLW